MIYLDHAATSYPKSEAVRRAMSGAMVCSGANPGRGGYPMAIHTAEHIYSCRETAAELFGLSDPRTIVFTLNCTQALNTVINALLGGGGRATVSDMEHNAVMRPLHALSPYRPIYDVATVTVDDDDATVAAFRKAITPQTRALICTHASNVVGNVLPIVRLAKLAHEHGIPIVVDAAQSAGHIPIDMMHDELDFVCTAGHKGLGGPMGTGMLLCLENTPIRPLVYGGTGSFSQSLDQPTELPERLESGTPNVAGICGLHAGMKRVMQIGIDTIAAHELALQTRLYEWCSSIDGVRLYSPRPIKGQSTPVLSFTVDGKTPAEVADALAAYGIAVRAGLHCAPAAHRKIGTLPTGTVRVSVGAHNTMQEMHYFAQILKKIATNTLLFCPTL